MEDHLKKISEIKTDILEKELTPNFKEMFLEALTQYDKEKNSKVQAAAEFMDKSDLFVDAVAVSIFLNNGVVLQDREVKQEPATTKSDWDELEKEFQQQFDMYLSDESNTK